MEATPEKKSRRGRPRVTPPEWDRVADNTHDKSKTRRTKIKRFFATMAIGELRADENKGRAFAYICNPKSPRWEILAELGRLNDPARIREAATHICEQKIKVKDAVAMLRNWRTGTAKPGNKLALADEIERVIRNYKIRHPNTSNEQIHDALEWAGLDYPRSGAEDDGPAEADDGSFNDDWTDSEDGGVSEAQE